MPPETTAPAEDAPQTAINSGRFRWRSTRAFARVLRDDLG
jgi:hypothetical protein